MVGLQYGSLKTQLGEALNGIVNYDFYVPEPTLKFDGISNFLSRYQAKATGAGVDPLGYFVPPFAYADLQVLGDAVPAVGNLDQKQLGEYIRTHTFHTIVGDVGFAANGEWSAPRVLQVQFQSISGNSLDQFKKPATQLIGYPPILVPATPLSPADSRARARMRACRRFFEEVPPVAVRFPSSNAAFARHFANMSADEFRGLAKYKPLRDKFLGEMDKEKGFSVDKLRQAEDSIRKTVTRMESALVQTDYLLGSRRTLADFCVLPLLILLEDLGYDFLWSDKPGVTAWLAPLKAPPSFKTGHFPGLLPSQ